MTSPTGRPAGLPPRGWRVGGRPTPGGVHAGCPEPGRPASGTGRDAGSGAVLVLAVVAVALSLVLVAGLVGSAHVAEATAVTAADLAALAAAQHVADGGTDPCEQASGAARRNGALLTSCTPGPAGDVTVRVRATTGIGDARAVARAGPRPPLG